MKRETEKGTQIRFPASLRQNEHRNKKFQAIPGRGIKGGIPFHKLQNREKEKEKNQHAEIKQTLIRKKTKQSKTHDVFQLEEIKKNQTHQKKGQNRRNPLPISSKAERKRMF